MMLVVVVTTLAAAVQGFTQGGPCTAAAGPFSWPQVIVTLIGALTTFGVAYLTLITRALDKEVRNGGE